MRTLLACVTFSLLAVPLACGGGQGAADTAKSPGGAAPSGTDVPAPPASTGPTTTTTTTLADGGDLLGTKLQTTTTVASTTGSAAPTPKPHGHEPGRGPEDLRAIIVAHRDEARACYDKAIGDHPGIEGALVVQWTIDPKGVVTQISEDTSRSQITEPGVVACVVKIIQGIQFAPSPGGFETKAYYPFDFKPRRSQQRPSGQ